MCFSYQKVVNDVDTFLRVEVAYYIFIQKATHYLVQSYMQGLTDTSGTHWDKYLTTRTRHQPKHTLANNQVNEMKQDKEDISRTIR